jgi:nucleoid DNA-binding protein
MGKKQWMGLGVLLGTLGLFLTLTDAARSQRPLPKIVSGSGNAPRQAAKMTLEGRVMDYSKLKEKETKKFLDAVGPAVRDLLENGQQVNLSGLGTFRIVNVPAHRDMVAGRPATIAAVNYVEFVPSADLAGAANSPSATPAEVVPPFQYIPIPGRDPGMKVGNTRAPNVRTR